MSGPRFERCWLTLEQHMCVLMLVSRSRFFKDLGEWIWTFGALRSSSWYEKCCTSQLSALIIAGFYRLRCNYASRLIALAPTLMTVDVLRDKLEIGTSICKFQFRNSNLENKCEQCKFQISTIQNFDIKVKKLGTRTIHKFQNFRFSDIKICFKDVPINFLYSLK